MLTRNAVRLSITCGVASQLEILAMSAAECRSVLECAKNSPEHEISAAANHVARPQKWKGGGGGHVTRVILDQGSATFNVKRDILAHFLPNKIHLEPQNIWCPNKDNTA